RSFFFFQAEDGIRDWSVTGVQTCALPIFGEEGSGFVIAQARLGPGRIHHCMRSIGGAERALELLCKRAASRVAFGSRLIEKQTIQSWIAESRLQIYAARLLCLHASSELGVLGTSVAPTD